MYRLALYFSHIQCFLPLFHRPRFYAEYKTVRSCLETGQQLHYETALILNGMFALSARFSDRSELSIKEPKHRGTVFANKARALFDYSRGFQGGNAVTLRTLQGLILLTYHQLSSEHDFRGLVAVGMCCRIAYALSLHRIDAEPTKSSQEVSEDAEAWADKEEKRRAWWACWEMDTFSATIACQPFGTDMYRVHVKLPVPDDAWFNLKPLDSAILASRKPLEVWKSLKDSPNQNEHAWFLVANCLMRYAVEMFESHETSTQNLEALQTAVHCCALSLPPRFRLSPANILFNESSFSGDNWVIITHLMLHG